MRMAGFVLIVAVALGGCVAAVVGHGGGAAGPPRGEPSATPAGSDARLASEVRARLATEKGLAAGGIEVRVREGTVTLRGRVAGAAQRAAAERVARSVPGVRAVVSELEVK